MPCHAWGAPVFHFKFKRCSCFLEFPDGLVEAERAIDEAESKDPALPSPSPLTFLLLLLLFLFLFLLLLMHQQWRISLHARARGFHLRMRVSNVLHGWGGHSEEARFSIVVRVRSFLLRLRSGRASSPAVLRGRSTFGSRVLRLIRGVIRRRPWPRRLGGDAITAEETLESRCRPGSGRFYRLALWSPEKKGDAFLSQAPTKGLLGSLAFLSYSASHRNHGGVIIHAAVSIFYLILLSKVALARRARSPLTLGALFTSLGVFSLGFLHFMGQISEAAWMVYFNILAFAGLLPLARCQVVLSKILIMIGRNFRFIWVIAMGFLFFFCEMHPRKPVEIIKMIINGSTTWIPHLLLAYHALSHVMENPKDRERLAMIISLLYFLVTEIILTCRLELKLPNVDIPYIYKRTVKELGNYLYS